jgi:hypothetical protein
MSLAVHAVLIGAWQLGRPVKLQDDIEPRRVQFLRLLPKPAPEREDGAPTSPNRAVAPVARAHSAARPQAAVPAPVESTPETIALPAPPTADTPGAPPSAIDLLRDAKSAVGAIDRALRAENPRRGIHAPLETAQMKLEKGINHAAEMAPNRWYQAPKVQEIQDPGGYGRKRYRVVGANGTYCVTYESNHGPDGIDTMQRGIQPKVTSCPQHEEPATSQKWE